MVEGSTPVATISVVKAAKLLGIAPGSGYRAVRAGQIPAVRVGRRWLVLLVPFERMLAGEPRRISGPAER